MKILQNKRAIITGGSDGIGFSIAKAFVENGADVVLIARDKKKLDKACAQLSASNNNEIIGISADLSSISAIDQLAAQLTLTWPEIDILVNNAGTACFLPFADISQTEVDLLINLNIKAPFVLTQQLMVALERRKGNIINISSYFSHRMIPGRPSTLYSSTKGAIDSFTKALACELGSKGIRVNAIAPGTVNTILVKNALDGMSTEARETFLQSIKTIYPLGRTGEPDDLGGIAVLLASEQASWITGAIISVDGGLTTN